MYENTNEKMFTNYTYTREIWDHNQTNIDNIFSFTISTITKNDFELQIINECRQRDD